MVSKSFKYTEVQILLKNKFKKNNIAIYNNIFDIFSRYTFIKMQIEEFQICFLKNDLLNI